MVCGSQAGVAPEANARAGVGGAMLKLSDAEKS
jgi:hypothetical protein